MKNNLKFKIETITPLIAKQALKKVGKNRVVIPRRVKHWARIINEGNWKLNGEAIQFAKDGTLMNGQHRLSAVVETKKPIQILVVRGLDKSVMSTLDTGKPRNIGDHLKMQGHEGNTRLLAAAATIGLNFKTGQYSNMKGITSPMDAISYIKENPRIIDSCFFIDRCPLLRGILPPSIGSALHFLFSKIHRGKADTFFKHLESGEGLGKTSSVLILRTQLMTMQNSPKRNRINRKAYMYYVCAAFNAYLNNKRVQTSFQFKIDSTIKLPSRNTQY